MTTDTIVASVAAAAFAAATAAVVMVSYEANVSLAASASQRAPPGACAQDWLAGYNAGEAARLRVQLTRTCTPSMR
jgi:hypothetical protein